MENKITDLLNKYASKRYELVCKKELSNSPCIVQKIRQIDEMVLDLKSLNEAIVRKPDTCNCLEAHCIVCNPINLIR